jgi:hypothetical protein
MEADEHDSGGRLRPLQRRSHLQLCIPNPKDATPNANRTQSRYISLVMLHPCTSVRFGALSALALLLAREMLFIGTQFTSTLLLASHANPQPELSSLIFEAKQLCDAARVLRYVHCSCVYVVASSS